MNLRVHLDLKSLDSYVCCLNILEPVLRCSMPGKGFGPKLKMGHKGVGNFELALVSTVTVVSLSLFCRRSGFAMVIDACAIPLGAVIPVASNVSIK